MNLISPIRKYYYLKKVQKNQWKNLEELKEIQRKKLREIICFSYENIPFYHHRFEENDIHPDDIKSKSDLKKIPVLTKEEIQENYDDIVNPNIDLDKARVVPTSGSTGTPLKVVYDKKSDDFSKAVNLRSHVENGLSPFKKWAIIGDDRTVPPPAWFQKLGLFRINYINLFDEVKKQIEDLKRFRPDILTGFPSQIELISERLNELDIDIDLETVFTTAEVLDEVTRSKIEGAFNTDVIDLFGCVEVNRTAWECKEHNGYHIDIDSVVMEFVKDNEEVGEGEWGDILYTSLYNYSMPLIRYDVGDRGVPSDEMCECGRGLPLMDEVLGRKEDFVELKNGKSISPIPFHLAVKHIGGIKEAKIIQKKKDKIEVLIEVDEGNKGKIKSEMRSQIDDICDGMVEIEMDFVDEVPSDDSGKIRMVKREI